MASTAFSISGGTGVASGPGRMRSHSGCAGDNAVTNRQCYKMMKQHGLLQKRKTRAAEVYQTAKLFELLPSGPNELWQMDVTYIHIPGFGWWYAVTVIDYYSRYLLAAYLTPSYSALAATEALALARREAERLWGPDNGSTFIAKRFVEFRRADYCQVRIRYRTPTQLGLLEHFHRTLKEEEVYWRLYDNPPLWLPAPWCGDSVSKFGLQGHANRLIHRHL